MRPIVIVLALASTAACSAPREPPIAGELPKSPESSIGYETVAKALEAVRATAGAETRVENGWLVVIDEPARTIWSFAPEGHPAYPTVVQRVITPAGDGSTIQTNVRCESDKISCDNVVLQFEELADRALGKSR